MLLKWADYNHFPYERDLALREASAVLGGKIEESSDGHVTSRSCDLNAARKLTYFAEARAGEKAVRTLQNDLEISADRAKRRQSTRYSVHGLHDYRGKFNPQVCAALINIIGISEDHCLLDPFCGSGTTLVEAAHRKIKAVGTDLNPLAVFVANAKLCTLTLSPQLLARAAKSILSNAVRGEAPFETSVRIEYLRSWFEEKPLEEIERLRVAIELENEDLRPFFYVVASNLLRDFSLQNPADLRIRRRASANATESFFTAFDRAVRDALRKLQSALAVVTPSVEGTAAYLCDNRSLETRFDGAQFDGAITSPPYATALPYIDTQRLSLVWLGLIDPSNIAKTEADLIGSREMSVREKRAMSNSMMGNVSAIPADDLNFCLKLQNALSSTDGFRRQAVPVLLYRYFDFMSKTFRSVRRCFREGGQFALIVGHNHTQLGGKRFDINTPAHLASLAAAQGWSIQEITPLQPYQRFGLHAANAVSAETLLVLSASTLPGG